jgi:hypothetical protein
MEPLAKGQDLPRSLHRSTRKPLPQPANLTLTCELNTSCTSRSQGSHREAKVKAELAAQEMFQLYANLLSIGAKYAWNKIVQEQAQSDPYTDL